MGPCPELCEKPLEREEMWLLVWKERGAVLYRKDGEAKAEGSLKTPRRWLQTPGQGEASVHENAVTPNSKERRSFAQAGVRGL